MKGVKLTERIRYMHCEEDGDVHGILVLLGNEKYPTKTFEVYDQADFRRGFHNFKITEDMQAELAEALKQLVTV